MGSITGLQGGSDWLAELGLPRETQKCGSQKTKQKSKLEL